jgi:ATP-dependent exoDNAse (exonuclease V) beta subunit
MGRDVFALLTLHLYPHHAPKYAHTRLEKRLTPDMFGRLQQSLTAIPTMQPPKAWFDAIRPFLVIRPGQADLDKATDAEFLEAMQAVATQFDTLSAFHQHISTTTLDSAPTESNSDARVQLHTVHTAKGKEFTHVAYFNLGWVSARATPEAVADERRVTYVGLTRAKEHLLVTSDQARPSAFLRELALNSAYHEFAIPYLSRQKDSVQKKLTQRRANLQKGEEKLERYEQEQIDSNDARQNRWRRLRNLQLERETQRLRERTDGYRTEIPDLEATINALSREIAFRKLLGVD